MAYLRIVSPIRQINSHPLDCRVAFPVELARTGENRSNLVIVRRRYADIHADSRHLETRRSSRVPLSPMKLTMDTYDLICIGCGPAGEKAATQASYFKHRVAIVEASPFPGGAMVNTGTIPSKSLRESALLLSALRNRPIPGLEYKKGKGLSVMRMMALMRKIQLHEHDRIAASIDRHGIDVFHGHGRLVDAHTVEVQSPTGDTEQIRGRFVLLATGSRPVRPDFIPFDLPCVVDADGVLQLDYIPRSMIVVGAGVIGCEYASIFNEIGSEVTLINSHAEILPFLDPDCRTHIADAMANRGIRMVSQSGVADVSESDDRGVTVLCDNGQTHSADVLLWVAGRAANSDKLWLDNVGVETTDRGLIKVNEHFQTSVPSIYAGGDVIGFPALAATSMEQGRVAACHMFGLQFKEKITETIPIGIYTVPGIAMVGMTEQQAVSAGHEVVVGRAHYRNNVRGQMLGDEDGILKCVFDFNTRQLLGTFISGDYATELIHIGQGVIANGHGLDYFIQCCFNYPSLSELYKYATYDALQTIAEIEGREDQLGGQAKVA